jgi:hypothetical protein
VLFSCLRFLLRAALWHAPAVVTQTTDRPNIVFILADCDLPRDTLSCTGGSERKRGYLTEILTDYAVNFIRQSHAGPFLLYLAHKTPHSIDYGNPHASVLADGLPAS